MPDASNLPEPSFIEFTAEHVDEIVELGADFFAESEFSDFAEYSEENFRSMLYEAANSLAMEGLLFTDAGRIRGMIFFQLDMGYTVKPIALMWLFYVAPEYRKSPVGRVLLALAEGLAKLRGATAFYGGSMAGIPEVKNTIRNLYNKAGYEELYWGRKILKGEDDV